MNDEIHSTLKELVAGQRELYEKIDSLEEEVRQGFSDFRKHRVSVTDSFEDVLRNIGLLKLAIQQRNGDDETPSRFAAG